MFSLLSYHGVMLEEYKGMSKKKAQPFRIREILPTACHEAGHAVVGHVIGRLIEGVSIVPDRARGYKDYCRFSAFMESANDRFQWQEGSANPEIVTIFMQEVQLLTESHLMPVSSMVSLPTTVT